MPSWYGVQANILQKYCTICHSGAGAPTGLSWEVDRYAAIVTAGRMSTEVPSMREVDPGNPDTSYMLWKLRGQGPAGQAIVGVRMPAFGAALDPALIAVVEDWIRAGAPIGVAADADSGGAAAPPAAGGGTPAPPPADGGSTPPPSAGGGTPAPSSIVPTWYGVQANIFQRYCTLCHSGTNPPMGLSWEVGQYAPIVTNRRMSGEIATMAEVEPGNPDASYLIWKVTGRAGISGVRMPATGIPLDQALIDVLIQWVRAGAPLGVPADADAGAASAAPAPVVGSWKYVWTEALQICTMCHSPTPSSERCGRDFSCPPKGVVLTLDNYAGVVNGDIVRPFRPDNSKLYERVTERDPSKRMPFGLDPLSQRQLDIIRDWIASGAPSCPANQTCP